MAKMKSWLNLLKKLFVSDPKTNHEKKKKKRRWLIGRFKWKCLPALAAPLVVKDRSLIQAENDHSKRALTAAIATAAAAKAALASAQAAVEVVRLTGTPWPYLISKKGSRALAAIKIQTAFRGYLARKALRALKGLVRLQAIVRGQAVRRQVITTLNGLQTLVKIQSQLRVTKNTFGDKELIKNFNELGEKKTMFGQPEYSRRGLVATLTSKKDIDALFMNKHEALIKRECVKEYLLSHREKINPKKFKDSEADNVNGSLGYWLGQRMDAEECKSGNPEKSEFVVISSPVQRNIGELKYHEPLAVHTSPITPPRRSFDRPRRSSFEDSDSLGSPVVPNYMSATESAKARLRSISLPKLGLGSLDIYSDHGSPSKNRLSFSSISTDASTTFKGGKVPSSQQRSPSLKGILGPIKSYQTVKDLSVDSDSSLNWFQHR